MDIKGCGQLTSNGTYSSNIWFSGVRTAEKAMDAGVDYYRPAKTSHKGFYLATLENLMKDWPRGSYLVINSTPRFTGGRTIMAIGHKYSSRIEMA